MKEMIIRVHNGRECLYNIYHCTISLYNIIIVLKLAFLLALGAGL
jgi:hypothetical protein